MNHDFDAAQAARIHRCAQKALVASSVILDGIAPGCECDTRRWWQRRRPVQHTAVCVARENLEITARLLRSAALEAEAVQDTPRFEALSTLLDDAKAANRSLTRAYDA